MNTILKGPIQTNARFQTISILLEDPDLAEAVAECPTPEAKRELVQDCAEIGIRISERHQTDQNMQSVVDALERQNDRAQERYEEQRRDETARWDQQRKLELQLRDQQAAMEKQRYEAQLAEQKRQFEAQLEAQKATFERRAEAAQQQQSKEREAHQRELQNLNATVNELSEVVSGDSDQSRMTLRRFEKEASGLLKTLLGEVREQLSQEEQTGDQILDTVEKAVQNMTSDLTSSFQQATVIIQSQAEREEARRQADELREKTSNYKGVAFEKGLLNDLVEFAGTRTGDQVEHTGANAQEGSTRKTGDLVYTLQTSNGPVKVALEAKDRKLPHGGAKKYFLDEINHARELRGAKYGIVVASLDKNTIGDSRPRDPFFKDLGDGNFLVLVDESQPYSVALRTAFHWIHNLEKTNSNGKVDKKLFEQVQVGLGRIGQLNDRFTSLKSFTTTVIKNLTSIREELDELDADLTGEVSRLEELLK